MGPLRPPHLVCLRAVADQQATVDADGFTIGGVPLTGDLHLAMHGLWRHGLVYGPDGAAEPELLWLTEAGEHVLAANKQTEEFR